MSAQSLDFKVQGGYKLSGKVVTNTSKNGAMGLLAASILNKGTTILHGIPRIEEVNRICEVLESIGMSVEWVADKSLKLKRETLDLSKINYESATKTRTILMFIGSLVHIYDDFKIPNSQGCKLGKRSIAAHQLGLEKLGFKVKTEETHYRIKKSGKATKDLAMFESGDTATENLIIAASGLDQTTTLRYVSSNYMVQDVCGFMEMFGVKIKGFGTPTLQISGVKEFNQDVEYYNSEDPIEAMMWISAALTTQSQLTIQRAPFDFLEVELEHLRLMGAKYKLSKPYMSKNGFTRLVDIELQPSKLKAINEKIAARPYPGINPDNLPFFVPICALAKGQSLIHDWMFENRAIYFMELTRLGADFHLGDPHRLFIEGIDSFSPAQVVCPPALRPAMIVLIAMLSAKGESILRNVYSIKRGYEEIAERLNELGAKIDVIEN